MINQAFKVLTEFRFDVGHAVANTEMLQSAVGNLSSMADNTLLSFQRLGFGIAAQFGLGTGGVLGTFYKGIQASDKFYQSQLKLSNIMQSNGMFTGADGFEKSMAASAVALENMSKAAKEFSLPATDLVNLTSQIGAVLTVKGLDDSTFGKSMDISRQFLKSAPILGVDPGLATQQLVGAISGRAELGSTLVQRLLDETTAMAPFRGQGGLKKLNAMDPAARLDVLTKSLAQFSSNAKVTDSIAKSMSGQLRRLNDNLMSMFSILRPIGDALMQPIKDILNTVNNYLEKEGAAVVKNLSGLLQGIFKDPEALYATLKQLSNLQKDLTSAGKSLFVLELLSGLLFVMGFFGVKFAGVAGMIGAAARKILSFLAPLAKPVLGLGLKALGFIMARVLPPLMAMVFLFQAISRGMALAEVANAKWLAQNMPHITELLGRLGKAMGLIFLPVTMAIDALAQVFAWLFRLDISGNAALVALEGLVIMFEFLGKVVVHVLSLISGVINTIVGQVYNMSQGNFKALFSKTDWSNLADEGYQDFWKKFFPTNPQTGAGEQATSNKVTNVGKIEIVNQFKEQMEPDRIAFTLKEQLVKLATNPQQATGRSMRGASIGN